MTITAQQAAKTLAIFRDWSVTNLELQKLVYMAHLVHLGEQGEPLVRERFEAWDYGPVVPDLYHHLKGFGSNYIGNVFHSVPMISEASPEFVTLAETERQTRDFSAAQLVAITHWDHGAWAKTYRAGSKHAVIPNGLILDEYVKRTT